VTAPLDDLIREAFLWRGRAEVLWLVRRRFWWLALREAARKAREEKR